MDIIKVDLNPEKKISLHELTDRHFVGVLFSDGVRGYVLKLGAERYINVTGDGWGFGEFIEFKSIQSALTEEEEVREVYVFPNLSGLYSWLANG